MLTLTEEHARLLGQVAARAEDLLTVVAEGRWPRRELRALVGYVGTEVLRQANDEEWLLFPAFMPSPDLARLSRDHLRLRHGAEVLAGAADNASGWSAARLATTTRDFQTLLERHLVMEEKLLIAACASHPVPAIAALTGRGHERYPLTAGTVIDLDALPCGQRAEAAVDRPHVRDLYRAGQARPGVVGPLEDTIESPCWPAHIAGNADGRQKRPAQSAGHDE